MEIRRKPRRRGQGRRVVREQREQELEGEPNDLGGRELRALGVASFLGKRFSITKNRGQVFSLPNAPVWLAIWHPSALLRAEDPARAAAMRVELVADLRIAKDSLASAA